MTKFDSEDQARQVANLALGRIFRIMSRPFEVGDVEQYENCKFVFMDAMEHLGIDLPKTDLNRHNPGWNFGNQVLD